MTESVHPEVEHVDVAEPDSRAESGSDFEEWLADRLDYDSLSDSSKYKADILLGNTPPPGCG